MSPVYSIIEMFCFVMPVINNPLDMSLLRYRAIFKYFIETLRKKCMSWWEFDNLICFEFQRVLEPLD